MADDIILVDENDSEIGTGEKMDVHRRGLLHRAFSVSVYNSKGNMLLQKRANTKYHCPGLWSNACCSHPRPGEDLFEAAKRRLKEEMGINYVWDAKRAKVSEQQFIYKVRVGDLIEHEYDHVLFAIFNGMPIPNPQEAEAWRWIDFEDLKNDIKNSPNNYTPWFKLMMKVCWQESDPGLYVPGLEKYIEKRI